MQYSDGMSVLDREVCSYDEIQRIADGILAQTKCRPKIGIICGSGLGALADVVKEKTVIPYSSIQHFPVSTGTNCC